MGKIKRMDQVRQILETYLQTKSIKGTVRLLGSSKNTVKGYVRRGKSYNKDLSQLLLLSDAELKKVIYAEPNQTAVDRQSVFQSKVGYWIKELRRVGVTRHLLWEEYREEYPDGYSYGHFCEHLGREIARKDLTINLKHKPGQYMQVDFAGKKMHWIDVNTGELHECEVLVVVFPHSQYTFCIALESQKVEDFIHGLNQAFLYFKGLPEAILSDNLKSYVTTPSKYDPKFNELCVQLAAHYQIDLSATRVRKPKDKASVENMVKTVYTRIYAPLRNKIFHSIEELNEAIMKQLTIHNNTPYQQKPGTRHEIFHTFELPVMKELPADLFEIKRTITPKVRRNYHIYLGQDKVFYSVPYQHALKSSVVIYTSKTVEIYVGNQRVATHKRIQGRSFQQYVTKEGHAPRSHEEWEKAQGYNAAYFLAEAEKIGQGTRWAIGQILLSRIHESQSYNSCKGVLQLAKKYSNVRLENAVARCQIVGKTSYSMLKNILERNLDQQSDQLQLFNVPVHENIRGPQAYQ